MKTGRNQQDRLLLGKNKVLMALAIKVRTKFDGISLSGFSRGGAGKSETTSTQLYD